MLALPGCRHPGAGSITSDVFARVKHVGRRLVFRNPAAAIMIRLVTISSVLLTLESAWDVFHLFYVAHFLIQMYFHTPSRGRGALFAVRARR